MLSPKLVMIYLWFTYATYDLLMQILLTYITHDLLVFYLWFSYDIYLCFTYDLLMTTYLTYDLLVIYLWITFDYLMIPLWFPYDLLPPMITLWQGIDLVWKGVMPWPGPGTEDSVMPDSDLLQCWALLPAVSSLAVIPTWGCKIDLPTDNCCPGLGGIH